MRALALAPLLVLALAFACKNNPDVEGFADAGAPCSQGTRIDCGQFANVTCPVPGDGGCEIVTFGCADAGFFTNVDTSRCPEGGLEGGPPIGDSSLIKGDGSGADGARE